MILSTTCIQCKVILVQSIIWCVEKYIFEVFLSKSFKIGGSITKLLNQFDDWWFRKSKEIWVSYRTPHQQNESWSWKSSELHRDETSQYPRATGDSRFIFSSKLKLIIPIFKSFKSDCTLKFAYSLQSSGIFKTFMNTRPELAGKTSVEI